MKSKCPLCGEERCSISSDSDFFLIDCATFGSSVNLTRQTVDDFSLTGDIGKIYNLIVERLTAQPAAPDNASWVFYCEADETVMPKDSAYVNLANLLPDYPLSIMDKARRILLNLSHRHPGYGAEFEIAASELRLYFPDNPDSSEEAFGAMKMLVDLGYVRAVSKTCYYITAEGCKIAEDAKLRLDTPRQGFIAMSGSEAPASVRNAIHRAIRNSGYSPVAIDEKIHNNMVVPETLYEIQRSKFLVVDISYSNPGAYYEAGYAQALGKEVIVCCKSSVFADPSLRPRFDIARGSPLLWSGENDLVLRLQRRIGALIK